MVIDWQDISTWRVMIVDDEPDNLEVVAETLEFRGAQVTTAPNGKDALEALDTFEANLIVTDLSMPVMDGWALRSQVQGNPKLASIPILALSAHAMAGDPERALEAGFDGYLIKPVNILTLADDIRKAASNRALADETRKDAGKTPLAEEIVTAAIKTTVSN